MISQASYNIGKLSADALMASIGHVIVPGPSSLIGNLVSISYTGTEGRLKDGSVATAKLVADMTKDSSEGASMHTHAIGAIIDELTPRVAEHISFVQNSVKPLVVAMQDAIEQYVEANADKGAASFFDVVKMSACPLVDNESFMDLINRFKDDNMPVPVTIRSLPAMPFMDLVEVMSVSSKSVDSELKEWLAEKGEDYLLGIWREFFAANSVTPALLPPNSPYLDGVAGLQRMPTFQRIDDAIVVFLLSRGLLDNPMDEAGDMTLAQWRGVMDQYSRFAGAQLSNAVKSLDIMRRSGNVLLSTSSDGKCVNVFAEAYNNWLNAGGSVDILLGASLSGTKDIYTASNLTENADSYQRVWNNYAAVSGEANASIFDRNLRAFVMSEFRLGLSRPIAAEIETFNYDNFITADNLKKAAEYLEKCTSKDLLDIEQVALTLIAKIRFDYTPAYQFLSDMLRMAQSGCTCPQEAAGIAAMNYVCDYLSPQLALVRK